MTTITVVPNEKTLTIPGDKTLTLSAGNSVAIASPGPVGGTGTVIAGDGIDVSAGTVSTDLKANGGLVIESTEVAVDLGASSITGTLAVPDGGTGATSYTNGQLLIGNTTGNTLALGTLTGGEGIDITNSTGTITIAGEDASATNKGIVELATDAETNTGTSTTLAITPANITAWTGDTALVTVGALNAGSITSGFGNIDNGTSSTATGNLVINTATASNVGLILKTTDDSGTNDLLQVQNAAGTTFIKIDGDSPHRIQFINTGDSVFIGDRAGENDDLSANQNVYIGSLAGLENTTGSANFGLGFSALQAGTTARDNVGIGKSAARDITGGIGNLAIGSEAMRGVTTGNVNIAIGGSALKAVLSGSENVAIGRNAGTLITGTGSIFIGEKSGDAATTGDKNIAIGYQVDLPSASGSNQMTIGNIIFATGVDGTGTIISAANVGIATATPDRRFHVESSTSATNAVTQVTRFTSTSTGTPADGIGVGIEFEVETAAGNNEVGATIEVVATDTTSTSEDFAITFNTMKAGATATEGMRLTSANQLGINTPTPAGRLHLFQSSVRAPNSAGDDLILETAGNVGMSLLSGTGSNGFLFFGDADDDDVGILDYDHANDSFGLTVNAARRFTIVSSGNVGINTILPQTLLEVSATDGTAALTIRRADLSIVATNVIGDIDFAGNDVDGAETIADGIGARIRAIASNSWGSAVDDHPCDLQFFTQSNTVSNGLAAPRVTIHDDGSVGIGTTLFPTGGGTPVLALGVASGDPTSIGANTAGIFVKDVSSSAELFAFDEAGNVAPLSPHDSKTGEWIFYSKNTKTGRVVRVRMEEMMRRLSKIVGPDLFEEFYEGD